MNKLKLTGGGYSKNLVSPSERKFKFIDFFAGIGGFRRGMELAGHKCVGFCEWDKFAVASYTSMHLLTETQRYYLSQLTIRQRQKEILKEEYRNGEWYVNDIRNVRSNDLPKADCWCFGAPCQDFSIAGKRAGLDGDRSSLIREIFRLLEEQEEQDRPEWLIYENVKGMLSSNRGLDYLSILSEMDRLGYDIEWQNINSSWFVPQNRERIYTVGHLRRFGQRKILPIERTDGENSVCQIGNYLPTKTRDNPNQGRIYDSEGVSPCLNSMEGGGREPSVGIKVIGSTKPQLHSLEDVHSPDGIISCLTSRDYKCPKQVGIKIIGEVNSSQDGQVHSPDGIAKCHSAGHNNSPKVAIPVLTPDRAEKRQNGRRFKENGEPMFTLTTQDRHGVGIEVLGGVYTNSSPEYNRGILPNASRTLKADSHPAGVALGIIDTQGRKDKTAELKVVCPTLRSETHGNLPEAVIKVKEATHKGYAEARIGDSINLSVPGSKTRRGRVGKQIAQTLDTSCNQGTPVIIERNHDRESPKDTDGIYVELPDGVVCYCVWYEKEQCYITIRKLTPKECFRLQGWTDDYFERAAFVNSDSQLYKQAGNGVTVNVVEAIAKQF